MTYNYSKKDFSKEDLKTLRNKANTGDAESQYLLANYYEDGLSIENEVQIKPNKKKAFQFTKLAYENGSGDALISYANYLTDDSFNEHNIKLGIALYKQAIQNKNSLGALNLAKHYSRKGEYKKAFNNYLLAEKLGGYFSFEIGISYYFGIGTKQDIKTAIKHFKSVIKNEKWYSEYEFEEVNYILGKIYLEGIHLKKSTSKAIKYFKIANRENDHRSAQDILLMLQSVK